MTKTLFILLTASLALSAQTENPGEAIEITECENGSAGDLIISDNASFLFATAGLQRVTDCGSKLTATVIRLNQCVVRPRVGSGASVAPPTTTSPSPTTPVLSFLDAGPTITVKGPTREIKLTRTVTGPITQYSYLQQRTPTPGGPAPAADFAVAGDFTVSTEAGRDLPAIQGSFSFQPLRLTRPVQGGSVPAADPPAVEWTGGEQQTTPVDLRVSASTLDGRTGVDILCRLENPKDGSFTLPAAAWELVPAAVKASGFATFSLIQSGVHQTLEVPTLDKGLRVVLQTITSASARLTP
jgi:hypothetical protein